MIGKAIRRPEDLALNGAPPALAQPVHVGRPNVPNPHLFQAEVDKILARNWLTNDGPCVKRFEAAVAERLGVRHCIATANGTMALEIALRALGLRGSVIVPSYTFIATAHAVSWLGLTPVFADIDPITHSLDPDAVERGIDQGVSGIIATHLWGRPCAVDRLQAVAKTHDLRLIFDAAHAFDCSLGPQMIGNFGDAEVLSFHATKFLNSIEGGALVTNDDGLAAEARAMRNFGFIEIDQVAILGTNAKMTEFNAAMGLANLASLEEIRHRNQENFECYADALFDMPGLRLFDPAAKGRSNFQYVVLEIDPDFPASRDTILAALRAENILARKYFWPGCHRMAAYADHPSASLPVTERVSDRVLVLPTGMTLDPAVIPTLRDVLQVLTRGAAQPGLGQQEASAAIAVGGHA